MKAFAGLLFLAATALAVRDNACPPEQFLNWEIEKLLAHEDCSKFYQCTHGRPVEMICPKGLFFNELQSICDWPANVDCQERSLPEEEEDSVKNNDSDIEVIQAHAQIIPMIADGEGVTEDLEVPEELPVTTPNTIEFLENGCPVDPHIHWLTPHVNDCTVFYSCVWGSKVQKSCPPTLHFNRDLQVCDWPQAAGCIVNADESESFNKHLPNRRVVIDNIV